MMYSCVREKVTLEVLVDDSASHPSPCHSHVYIMDHNQASPVRCNTPYRWGWGGVGVGGSQLCTLTQIFSHPVEDGRGNLLLKIGYDL